MADWYNKTLTDIGKALIDLNNLSNPKIVPVTIDYVFNQAHEFLSDIPGADRVAIPNSMTNVVFGPSTSGPSDYTSYWTMDNVDATTIFDDKGSQDITIVGTAVYGTGISGNALKKSTGTEEYSGSVNGITSDYSISFWIEQDGTLSGPVSTGGIVTIGSNFANQGIIIDVTIATGEMRFLLGNSTAFTSVGYGASGAADIRDSTRHHIALVIREDGGDSKALAYYDGVARSTETTITGEVSDFNSGGLTVLGRSGTTFNLVNLLIDDIKSYQKALSQSEVDDLFAGGDPQTTKDGWLDADDPVITSPTVDDVIEALIMFNDTGVEATSPLLFYANSGLGLPFTVETTGAINVQLGPDGIAKL